MYKQLYFTIAVLFFSLILYSCNTANNDIDKNKTAFRYNESKGIASLDPAYARNQTVIWPITQIFCGLVQLNNELEIQPLIAHDWNISEDGLKYTFFLRTDVYFHNNPCFPDSIGRKVTSQDFEYSFRRIIDPSLASPGSWIFNYLEINDNETTDGFRALNDSVFEIKLKEAFPPFLGMLSMPYCFVVPHEAVESYKSDFGRNPVGCGPFKFHSWKEEEKLLLLKNENYFERDYTGLELPYIDAVAITFIKDKQSEFLEFLKGNIDFLSGVHPTYKDELLTRSGNLNPKYRKKFKLSKQEYLNTEYLGFLLDPELTDSLDNPLLNKYLRKAINYGFDREKMIRFLRNNIGIPALSGFVPYGIPSFNKNLSGYKYDPDTAAYFLDKAGYKKGQGLPEIVLTTTSDYLDLCEFIQFELEKIGLKLKIDVATGAAFRNKVANSNLTFFRASWIADYPDAENFLLLFYSKNFSPEGPNYTHFSNALFDSLYIKAFSTSDDALRYNIYREMDSIILEESAIVPLYYDQIARFTSVKIDGLDLNPMNSLVLKKVQIKE